MLRHKKEKFAQVQWEQIIERRLNDKESNIMTVLQEYWSG